jgi:hypothetical protein
MTRRHEGDGFGNTVDGNIDPGRLLIHPRLRPGFGQIRPDEAVVAGDGFDMRGTPQPFAPTGEHL